MHMDQLDNSMKIGNRRDWHIVYTHLWLLVITTLFSKCAFRRGSIPGYGWAAN